MSFERYSIVLFCLSISVLTSAVRAELILDTGQGSNPPSPGLTLGTEQGLGIKITLTQTYSITAIEAWLWESQNKSGDVTLAIYGDGGDVPGDNQLFVTTFPADGPGPTEATWIGKNDLNWTLGPGSYWVTFRVLPPSTARFVAPDTSPAPLTTYSLFRTETNDWRRNSTARWGFRIQGVGQGGGPGDPPGGGGNDPPPADDGGTDPGSGDTAAPKPPSCGAFGSAAFSVTGLLLCSAGRRRGRKPTRSCGAGV